MTTSGRSHVIALLKEQTEGISQKKTIKLNSLNVNLRPSEIIDIIHEFLNSFDPPLDLEKLSLQNNQFVELPSNFHKIASHLKYLDLHQNLISYIPHDFFDKFPALEILDLASNRLAALPESLPRVAALKVVSIKDNNFKYLPPQLGELPNLNLVEVTGNPLILPSNDIIRAFQKQKPDLDWVGELKNYLVANRMLLYLKIEESTASSASSTITQDEIALHQTAASTPPSIKRAQTTSDVPVLRTKSSTFSSGSTAAGTTSTAPPLAPPPPQPLSSSSSTSSKASRRMGLIIKKSDEGGAPSKDGLLSYSENKDGVPHPELSSGDPSYLQQPNQVPPTVATTTISTAPTSSSKNASTKTTPATASTLSNPSRSRSNTIREIDRMLEKSESVDTEHKSNAYFKRLSTLQEIPADESSHAPETSKVTLDPKQIQAARSSSNIPTPSEGSPTRPLHQQQQQHHHHAKSYAHPIIIKVSRKILFSFSELHSSIRRFTSFCSDKKVTMKMVSFIYTTKSNIDSLVENLELMEESGSNSEQIVQALHNCIGSFRSIMKLLHENINAFVANIDVCFIRMVYLSLYGSFNELQNAYLILVSRPNVKTPTDVKQKLSINTSVKDSFEEVDEKLYSAIESATSSTQVIFAELNKAINKGATTANGGAIHPSVGAKIKELTNCCSSTLEVIKRLNTKLITISNSPSITTKKLFAEDINQFIKNMVSTLAAVKAIVKDINILDDIRASMSNLTKIAKEVTYLLELSSYKSLLPESSANANPQQPQLMSIPSVSNLFTPVAAHAPSLPLNGQASARNPLNSTTSSLSLPPNANANANANANVNALDNAVGSGAISIGPLTAPQSSGQMFAKNGMNPFDGLIMAKNNENH
ncbi:Leucine-rich repeat-containing protein SOG2 [Candida viswanathii]|uniref:Leucine-rich repeat-containing protein SOG2 n=1 Tax=Candida viswanathii TaxID=5486 RepID=A0A367XRZ5_9ASCO|nr:Leucine-rich repeat-containing protein SOG2 [Candida viswanathii]